MHTACRITNHFNPKHPYVTFLSKAFSVNLQNINKPMISIVTEVQDFVLLEFREDMRQIYLTKFY